MLTQRNMVRVLVGVLVAVLAGSVVMASRADAVPPLPPTRAASYTPKVPIQRIGLDCWHQEYLIWGVRQCVTIRARKDRAGRWWFQPAAVIAGYNAQGRRRMRFVAATRLGTSAASGSRLTERLVVRGPWQRGLGQAGNAKAVFLWRWPNGKKSAVKRYSDA